MTLLPKRLAPHFICLGLFYITGHAAHAAAPAQERRGRTAPDFDPMQFYTGRTRSWGVFENSKGEPTEQLVTETSGKIVNGELRMEQDLYLGHKPRQHRSWRMRRLDAHHFEATANDIIGVAHGEARGNHFTWTFTLATKPGNPLFNVRMTQHMYLQPDGRTMINRDSIRKFGFFVAGVTEQFRRV